TLLTGLGDSGHASPNSVVFISVASGSLSPIVIMPFRMSQTGAGDNLIRAFPDRLRHLLRNGWSSRRARATSPAFCRWRSRVEPASFARRETSREGLGTLWGFPF